jgi:hypothetical protein
MTLLRRAVSILFIPLMITSEQEAKSAPPCPTVDTFLNRVMNAKNDTRESLAKTFQKKNVKDFNDDTYLEAKIAYTEMKAKAIDLGPPPPVTEYEKYTAWMDTQVGNNSRALPTIEDVLAFGTEHQKRSLSKWISHYSPQKLTQQQTRDAAYDLSLILHDIHFEVADLEKLGAHALAKKMVKSQYHERMIYDDLRATMTKNGFFREETLRDRLKELAISKPAKWTYIGGANAYFIANAASVGHLLLLTLPDWRIAKLTMEDLELLIKAGPKTAEFNSMVTKIAARYENKIREQVFYDALDSVITDIGAALWVRWGYYKIKDHKSYEKDLKAEDNS